MTAHPKHKYTVEEYLEMDAKLEARLEYWNGEVFDMSGVDPDHDAIEGNVYHHLKIGMQGRDCRAFLANTRIKVPGAPPYHHGDLSALCDRPEYEIIGGVRVLTNPALIIEVLSGSTEGYDRGDKFTHYKSIPSFREYMLIAQHRPHVSHFVRQGDDSWNQREYNKLEAVVKLTSLDCELRLLDVYEGIRFDDVAASPDLRPLE
jgi:Uma2 family endonuclease